MLKKKIQQNYRKTNTNCTYIHLRSFITSLFCHWPFIMLLTQKKKIYDGAIPHLPPLIIIFFLQKITIIDSTYMCLTIFSMHFCLVCEKIKKECHTICQLYSTTTTTTFHKNFCFIS